jgi:CHAT domain
MLFLVCSTGLSASATTVEISSRTFGLIQQEIRQQPAAGSRNDDNEKDTLLLEPGKPLRRELAGGQQHHYRLGLGVNQLMKVAVLQDGIDVVVRLLGPDGAQIKEFNSASKPQGVEAVSRIAEVAGGYQLVVQPAQGGSQAGHYEIRVEELRASTDDEQALQEADNLYDKNVELEAAGRYDEALPYLWGTRLVVLSACDTGIGEVRNGEGVYGLRRSLVLAGSETQVMSLWPVLDRETRSLMVGYYRRLLRGEGRGEGLRQIQLELLKDEKQSHPYYWASFIQVGEWANLDGRR